MTASASRFVTPAEHVHFFPSNVKQQIKTVQVKRGGNEPGTPINRINPTRPSRPLTLVESSGGLCGALSEESSEQEHRYN
jgi:hypothetical protein